MPSWFQLSATAGSEWPTVRACVWAVVTWRPTGVPTLTAAPLGSKAGVTSALLEGHPKNYTAWPLARSSLGLCCVAAGRSMSGSQKNEHNKVLRFPNFTFFAHCVRDDTLDDCTETVL